jgi:hypothetical protein
MVFIKKSVFFLQNSENGHQQNLEKNQQNYKTTQKFINTKNQIPTNPYLQTFNLDLKQQNPQFPNLLPHFSLFFCFCVRQTHKTTTTAKNLTQIMATATTN